MDEAKIIGLVVESYGGFTTRTCCSFGVIEVNKKDSRPFLREVCHANLKYCGADMYDRLITSFPAKCELDYQFFDFLRNVMYKKWSAFIQLEKTEDGVPYIKLDLANIPANVVYNFCIASRIIVEHRPYLNIWGKLVEAGIHPAFALAVCQTDAKSQTDKIVGTIMLNQEHWPFYNTVSLRAVVLNGPGKLSLSFKCDPQGCTPTNTIWGSTTDLRELAGQTIHEFWTTWKEKNLK